MSSTPEIAELRELPEWQSLLEDIYSRIYAPAFSEDERENLADWRERLDAVNLAPPAPLMNIVLAGSNLRDPKRRKIFGMAVIEYYRESHCALLTYIVVVEKYRCAGVGRLLFNRARAIAHECSGGTLRALFAELMRGEDHGHGGGFSNHQRMNALGRLGACLVPVPYVQPELAEGKSRSRNLRLLAFPLGDAPLRQLPGEVVTSFINEFYRGLNVPRVDEDPDFQTLKRAAEKQGTLHVTGICCEAPSLRFKTFGVAFHFVLPTVGKPNGHHASSPEFAAFERDLLAFAFREAALFRNFSVPVPASFAEINIHFPVEIQYGAEGGDKLLVAGTDEATTRRTVRLLAAKTSFRDGTEIGHIILTNVLGNHRERDANTVLTEWDLVKLIKLWESGEKAAASTASVAEAIRFAPTDGTSAPITLGKLAARLFNERRELLPRTGTVQLLTDDEAEPERWEKLYDIIGRLKSDGLSPEDAATPGFMAVGGIIHGLMDFPYVDGEEMQEALEAAESSEESLLGIHKGTLYYFTSDCRAFRSVHDVVGISPYLLFPQAVMTYNEYLMQRAEEAFRSRPKKSRRHPLREKIFPEVAEMRRLNAVEHAMRDALQRKFIPDVFHYPAEHFLYERGHASRGLNAKRQSLIERIEEIHARYEELRADHQFHVEVALALVALLIAGLQIVEVFMH